MDHEPVKITILITDVLEIEIEIYPLQKGVLKDIISPVGCNNLVV